MRFKKKPVIVEAIQWLGNNFSQVHDFCPVCFMDEGSLCISTLEGVMRANPRSWIIRGVKGEYYPCREDVFYDTYEMEE